MRAPGAAGPPRARLDALVDALTRGGVPLTDKFATNAISAYVKVGAYRSAAALFDGCVADRKDSQSKDDDDDDKAHLYPVPNRRLVTAGVAAYGKCKRVGDAFAVASKMHLWGVTIDVVLGNALLAAAATSNDVPRAERLFAALTRVPTRAGKG